MTTTLMKTYDARLDTKKRLTLRGAVADYYAVKMFRDGHVVLEPRALVHPRDIPPRTLRMMDRAVANLKRGIVSAPIDFKRHLDVGEGE